MSDGPGGVKGALATFGRDVGSQLFYNTTGLKFKGVFSGLLRSLRQKLRRKAPPSISISARAGAAAEHGPSIRLRNGRQPALALDSLRARLRQPVAAASAVAAQASIASAPPANARGQAELHSAVIEESLSERADSFTRGVASLGREVDRLSGLSSFQQTAALRRELMDEIGKEFAQLRALRRDPDAGLSQQAAQHAEQLLASAAVKVMAPGTMNVAGADALALDMAVLSDRGVLTGDLLQAVAERAAFWSERASSAPPSAAACTMHRHRPTFVATCESWPMPRATHRKGPASTRPS